MFNNRNLGGNEIYAIYRFMRVVRGLIRNYECPHLVRTSVLPSLSDPAQTQPRQTSCSQNVSNTLLSKCAQSLMTYSSLHWLQYRFISFKLNTFFYLGRPYIPPCRFPEGFLTSPHAGETFTWAERGWRRLFCHRCPLESATLQVLTNAGCLFIFTW